MKDKIDYSLLVKKIMRKNEFSWFLKGEEFCFYVINGGYEKIFCSKLAYYLALELESIRRQHLVCIEGANRCDIVIAKDAYDNPEFCIEVKHSFTTYHSDSVLRLAKDIEKLNGMKCDGMVIYLVSQVKANVLPRGKKGGYKEKIDKTDDNLNVIKEKVKNLDFYEIFQFDQCYRNLAKTTVNILFWAKKP